MPSKHWWWTPIFSLGLCWGKRVCELIEAYAGDASFFVPEVAYAEAEEHLAALVIKRGGDPERRSHSCAPWVGCWN
jgi:hypothetical protein